MHVIPFYVVVYGKASINRYHALRGWASAIVQKSRRNHLFTASFAQIRVVSFVGNVFARYHPFGKGQSAHVQ
jgi:hypothetical protein